MPPTPKPRKMRHGSPSLPAPLTFTPSWPTTQATFAGSMDTLRRIAAVRMCPSSDWWDVITRYLDFDACDNLAGAARTLAT